VKLAGKLFLGGAVFYWLVTAVYWIMSHDEAGTVALFLTGALSAMIPGFVGKWRQNWNQIFLGKESTPRLHKLWAHALTFAAFQP